MRDGALKPPDGEVPPASVSIGDNATFDLAPLAREICRRYQLEFPDEHARYGDAGQEWCVHDNQHLLHWGAESVDGFVDMRHEVSWLARVLEARDFPLDRFARDLELAADVVGERLDGTDGEVLAAVFVESAAFVRARATFLA
jgi:hypothetical protein